MSEYGESRFFQAATNIQKLGAYYTDSAHCQRIGKLFDLDTAEEVCVLEPSIGDGTAVLEVTRGRPNCKIYGVEIQADTYKEHLEHNEKFSGILNEDFLRGVKISHGVFSFCFANPPYGVSKEDKKRLEHLFLERITWYLKSGAYLAYVIPYPVFSEEKFFRSVMTRYEVCAYYRFDDKEYEKYHQIVAVLRKKQSSGYLRTQFEQLYAQISDLGNYPYLPQTEDDVEKLTVGESFESRIEYFTSVKFKPEEAVKTLGSSVLFSSVGGSVFQKKYRSCNLNHPIVPVSNDIAYLLAVSGGGQGFAGDAEAGTLHLQRGVAKRAKEDQLRRDENGKASTVVSTTYTKTRLNIIENNGTITQL